jgi:transposase
MSMISAITSKGRLRFMIKERGGVNADVFIEFLKRLLVDAKHKIFLIVDRGPAHMAKKTSAFVKRLNGALRLFFLPPYSPDKNPDELVWKHVKADTVGRTAIFGDKDFTSKVRSSLRSLQRNPKKSAPSSKRTRSDTQPKCRPSKGNRTIQRYPKTGAHEA